LIKIDSNAAFCSFVAKANAFQYQCIGVQYKQDNFAFFGDSKKGARETIFFRWETAGKLQFLKLEFPSGKWRPLLKGNSFPAQGNTGKRLQGI
jgi:hypothetical protein